jgi:hypothetical protein
MNLHLQVFFLFTNASQASHSQSGSFDPFPCFLTRTTQEQRKKKDSSQSYHVPSSNRIIMAAKKSSDGVRQRKGGATSTTARTEKEPATEAAMTAAAAAAADDDDDDMPEDVKKVKDKLERETGKKYRYRPAAKDFPPVPELLKHGSGRPLTWKETIGYPALLALLFALTLLLFHHAVLVPAHKAKLAGKPWRQPYTLPKMKPRR